MADDQGDGRSAFHPRRRQERTHRPRASSVRVSDRGSTRAFRGICRADAGGLDAETRPADLNDSGACRALTP
jgi:hypothetical protein